VEDPSAPIPKEITSELGRIIVGCRLSVLSWEVSLTHVQKFMTMLENPACRKMNAVWIGRH
jgi:hypothetical protein